MKLNTANCCSFRRLHTNLNNLALLSSITPRYYLHNLLKFYTYLRTTTSTSVGFLLYCNIFFSKFVFDFFLPSILPTFYLTNTSETTPRLPNVGSTRSTWEVLLTGGT